MVIRLTGDDGSDFFITLAVGLVIIATLRYILYGNRTKTVAVGYREQPAADDESDDDGNLTDAEWVWATGAGWAAVVEAGEALGIGGPNSAARETFWKRQKAAGVLRSEPTFVRAAMAAFEAAH